MILNYIEVNGNMLTVTREELMMQLDACIDVQKESKQNNDFSTWLVAAGHIEAIKDMLACFESAECAKS